MYMLRIIKRIQNKKVANTKRIIADVLTRPDPNISQISSETKEKIMGIFNFYQSHEGQYRRLAG